ncbi:MAG: TolC family protein [Deltaproteobacteria bacterium]|nr:TolC family protein [Deltaproteobacteria bacterium]
MKVRLFLLGILALMLGIPACAGYQERVQTWKNYEPTPFYRDYATAKPTREISSTPPDRDFENQVVKIKEMKAQWEKALKTVEEEGPFYTPDHSRFQQLRPAGTDPSFAQAVLNGGFSLQDLENLAYLRNPGVKGAERTFRASLEAYSQVWNLDEILRQYTAFTEALMTGIGPMRGREPIEMKFPFPGVLALKGEIVTQEVKASRETLEISRRTAITQSRKTYWSLLFVTRAQEITQEMLSLLQHLEAVATVRYETGKTSFQDLIKIRIERVKLEEDLKTLREQQRNLEVKILEILDLPPATRVGAPLAVPPRKEVPQLTALYPVALDQRQELRRLRALVGKMERMIEMAETAIYPPYTLTFSFFQDEAISQVGTRRMKEPFATATTASTGAGLPKMPWYGSNDAYLREARQKLAALREDLKRMEDETVFKVREAWFRLDQARREEALYAGRVVGLSQAALDASTRGYETGKVTFADVISSYSGWLKDNLAIERRRSDLGISRAELEETLGAAWKD